MLVFLQNSKQVLNGWSLSGTLLTDIVHINIPTTIKGVKFLSVFFTLVAMLKVKDVCPKSTKFSLLKH